MMADAPFPGAHVYGFVSQSQDENFATATSLKCKPTQRKFVSEHDGFSTYQKSHCRPGRLHSSLASAGGGDAVLHGHGGKRLCVGQEGGEAKPTDFTPQRYTIKIVSDTERLITQIAGGPSPRQVQYECHQLNEVIACQSMLGATPWRFYRNTYTRAFLGGPPAGSTDPNIAIAYGTCTKF